MRLFATEFPVHRKNKAEFIAHVIQWLRGTEYSRVLESVDQEIQPDDFLATSKDGEQLRLREVKSEDLSALGFRHDFPDGDGRNWRTEAVLLWSEHDEKAKLRIRTQCQARVPGAQLDFPRKPYLIKSLLDDGWGSRDGNLTVSGTPKWLEKDSQSIELAALLMAGEGTIDLPILYVSATGLNSWVLSKDDIERLAYRLGGLAHVVVEPDRAFSFDLKDIADGRNAYSGSIGLYAPQLGYMSRFFRGWELSTNNLLMERIQSFTTGLRTRTRLSP